MSALQPRKSWIYVLFIMVGFLGCMLGKTSYERGVLHYEQLKEITGSFSKKGTIKGSVLGTAYRKERSVVYRFKIDNFDNFDKNQEKLIGISKIDDKKLDLHAHNPSIFVEVPSNLPLLSGDSIEFSGVIRSNVNFPLLQYDRYAFFQGGYGYLYVTHFNYIEKMKPNMIVELKKGWEQIFRAGFPRDVAGMSLGMTIGSTKYLTEEIKDAFLLSGITHILVVSGSNIAFVIVFITFFTRYIAWKNWVSTSLVIFFILAYVGIVGFGVPVIRAASMGILSYYATSLGSKFSSRALLGAILLILTILEPLSPLYDVGYGLSFGATLGIILFEKHAENFFRRYGLHGSIRTVVSVTLGATLGSLPIILYHFSKIPLSSILTNIIIGGFLGWILFSSTIFGVFTLLKLPLLKYFGLIVYLPIKLVIKISEFFSYGHILVLSKQTGTLISVFLLGIILYFFIFDEETILYPK